MFYDAYKEQAYLEYFAKIESCRTNFVLKIALINQNHSINARCSAYWKLAGVVARWQGYRCCQM